MLGTDFWLSKERGRVCNIFNYQMKEINVLNLCIYFNFRRANSSIVYLWILIIKICIKYKLKSNESLLEDRRKKNYCIHQEICRVSIPNFEKIGLARL